MVFATVPVVQPSPQPGLEYFHPAVIVMSFPLPLNGPSQPQATANLLCVSMDFLVLAISYIWKSYDMC
jgi:hypothetical protein